MKTVCLLSLFLISTALAQTPNPELTVRPPPPPAPCTSEKHRQFDFWLGEWDVTQNGQAAGHNRIERVHAGCALAENWTSANSAFSGSSFNIYDQANDKWHQTWVDSTGTLLELDGGLVDGKMVLAGKRPGADGGWVINRITFTPNEDGSVRQLWESSSDGSSWTTVFDGHYVRVGNAE